MALEYVSVTSASTRHLRRLGFAQAIRTSVPVRFLTGKPREEPSTLRGCGLDPVWERRKKLLLRGEGSEISGAQALPALVEVATSKGTIRFAANEPLPTALVTKLVKARIAETEAAAKRK
ncbi:MAG: hypothetical protein GEU75_06790 [Dehalococcoidia bacterium]|nr:hypothetical protein [Dehalococcoidia bacterium]